MVKHTRTICRLLPTNYLKLFDHFVGLALKGLTLYYFCRRCFTFNDVLKQKQSMFESSGYLKQTDFFSRKIYLVQICQQWMFVMFIKNVLLYLGSIKFERRYLCNQLFISTREKRPYLEFFWSVLSRIWTEYGEILRISPYSIRIRENTDQKNSEYGHFLHMLIPTFT